MKKNFDKNSMGILYIVFGACVLAFIILYIKTPVFHVQNEGPFTGRGMRRVYYKNKNAKGKLFTFNNVGEINILDKDDLPLFKVFTHSMTKGKRNFGGYFYQGILYDPQEGSITVKLKTGPTFVYPANRNISAETFKAEKMEILAKELLNVQAKKIGSFKQFLNDLAYYIFSPVEVRFMANRKNVWLSTPFNTKMYRFVQNNTLFNFLTSQKLSLTADAIWLTGGIKDNVVQIYMANINLVKIVLPREIQTVSKIEYNSRMVEQLNQMEYDNIDNGVKKNYFELFRNHLMMSNHFGLAVYFLKMKKRARDALKLETYINYKSDTTYTAVLSMDDLYKFTH